MTKAALEAKREYDRQYRKNNRERLNEYQRKWRENNRDKQKNSNIQYWERVALNKQKEVEIWEDYMV